MVVLTSSRAPSSPARRPDRLAAVRDPSPASAEDRRARPSLVPGPGASLAILTGYEARSRRDSQPTTPPNTSPASGARGRSVVTLTMMPSAEPSSAPSAIVAPTLTRASLCAVSSGDLPPLWAAGALRGGMKKVVASPGASRRLSNRGHCPRALGRARGGLRVPAATTDRYPPFSLSP